MKCPFRTDEKGEFMECYGKDCMAFVEYEAQKQVTTSTYRDVIIPKIITPLCRKIVDVPASDGYYR